MKDVPYQLGNYRLIREIGRGGFATVYLAKHLMLKHYAAVKVLQGINHVEEFRQEAQTLMDLRHPHIIRVLDFGVENETPYLIMDYAPHGSLRLQYPYKQQVPIASVLSYVRQVAQALQYAHQRRIVHRDVKPENMLIGEHNTILLSDFGIATLGQGSSHTQDVAGTLSYMAPEQIKGKPRLASDQYALGIVIYEWLTGRRPFEGSAAEITAQHLEAIPPPLRTFPHLSAVVLRALEKEPGQRYPTVLSFADALRDAAGGAMRKPKDEHFVTEMATFRMGSERPTTRKRTGARTVILTPYLQKPLSSRRQFPRRSILFAGLLGIGSVGAGAFFLPKVLSPILTTTSSTPTPNATPTFGQTPSPTPGQTSTPTPSPAPAPGTLYASLGAGHDLLTVSWSPDGKSLVAGTGNGSTDGDTVQIWNTANGSHLLTCTGHTNFVGSVAWSPDSTSIVSASADKTVRVWSATDGSQLFTCTGHTALVECVAWSSDGKYLVSGSADKTVRVWNAAHGSALSTYTQASFVRSVACSPDSKRIVSTNGKMENVWAISTATAILAYRSPNSCNAVVWSPDGTRIASGERGATVIWDAAHGNSLLTYTGHSDVINALAWSPDGTRIASASADKTVRVWSAIDGSTLFVFQGHNIEVFSVAWSPDGTRIASVGGGHALIWQAPS